MTSTHMTARLVGEFIGTALLLACVIGSGIMGDALSNGNAALTLLANSIATAAVLVVLITCLGPISGAHFNPAVTAVACARGEIGFNAAAAYIAVQIVGAAAGVFLAHGMFDLPLLQASTKLRGVPGSALSEAVATFGLILTIMLTAKSKPGSVATGVGLYVLAAYWFTASTSFANPAVTLARTLSNTFAGIRAADAPAFVIAQIAGALCAMAVVTLLVRGMARNSKLTTGAP